MTEDSTSPEQIRDAFASLASGKSHITRRDLELARVPAPITGFLEKAMGSLHLSNGTANGSTSEALDYNGWIRSLYPS
jgi:hypothetical protein